MSRDVGSPSGADGLPAARARSVEEYVTILDSSFLPHGLALHRSLARHAGGFRLWVLCVDQLAYDVLCATPRQSLHPILAADVEDQPLRQARLERTRGEYCWTLTPAAPRIVFGLDPAITRVTYLDADMYALADPSPIFVEFERSGKAVLITEHGYAPEYDQSAMSGRYCVQFVTFVRDASEPVRTWWEDRCIEWCYDRVEEGRFGDQKYLDSWPQIFESEVHVLTQRSAMLAPWNAVRFPYSEGVFYHFHRLRTTRRGAFELGSYHLPAPLRKEVYAPYIRQLHDIGAELSSAGHVLRPQASRASIGRRLKRHLGRYRRG